MSVEIGQKVPGKVTGITNFGAFVQLPDNQSGLVHISEVSDGFVKDINDILAVGDEVTVKVVKITPDGKINLSIRQASDNPTAAKPARAPYQDKGDRQQPNRFDKDRPERKPYGDKAQSTARSNYSQPSKANPGKPTGGNDFDSLMSQFLKDSEDRLTSLKRNTEGKRGGRGGRRN